MYYRISKNEKILFFGKKIAQVWAVTLKQETSLFVGILFSWAVEIFCSVELSMKKVL